MSSLATTMAARDEVILAHVDRLPQLADLVVDGALDAVRAPFELECRYLTEEFVPHLRAVETVIYPELDRLMSCCHSMLGMRQEHRELEGIVASLGGYCAEMGAGRLAATEHAALRHALYRLRSIATMHLKEESRLVRVLERNLSEGQADALLASVDERAGQRP